MSAEQIRWRLYAWQAGGALYRHWLDVELAVAWAQKFVAAQTLFEQLYCWARWIEAANLGAYALRRVGYDPTSAPIASVAMRINGKHGSTHAPAVLCESAPKDPQPRAGFVNPYIAARQERRKWYDFGAVEGPASPPAFQSLACAVVGNEGQYDNALFEQKLLRMLSDFGAPTAGVVDRVKSMAGEFVSIALPSLPGISVAVRWTPVVLDGFYDVVYLDDDEARLRSTLAFGDLRRPVAVNAYYDDGHIATRTIVTPTSFLPDLDLRRQEAGAFAANPFRWLELYTDAIIRRNGQWLAMYAPDLAASAAASSQSRQAALLASSAALNTLNTLNRAELQRQMGDAAGVIELVPILGQIVGGVLRGLAAFFSSSGLFDLPPDQKAQILREAVAPLAISGVAAADEAKAAAPSHAAAVPPGWTRGADVPAPGPAFQTVVAQASTTPLEPSATRATPSAPGGRTNIGQIMRNIGQFVVSRDARFAQISGPEVIDRARAYLDQIGGTQAAQGGSSAGVAVFAVAALLAGAVVAARRRK